MADLLEYGRPRSPEFSPMAPTAVVPKPLETNPLLGDEAWVPRVN